MRPTCDKLKLYHPRKKKEEDYFDEKIARKWHGHMIVLERIAAGLRP
jgi:hypothetical protein